MTVTSADEFYSIMAVLTREMLEFGLMDANHLINVSIVINGTNSCTYYSKSCYLRTNRVFYSVNFRRLSAQ